MEASALPASVGLTRTRIALGAPLLRLRSDEQLISLFRAGSDEAFRAIHDRYRQRLFAYARQMLGGSAPDAEDVVQDIFVRAYAGLRATHRQLALRAWLYRVAHNRCIDELRRPHAVASDGLEATATGPLDDPVARTEQRDALRRLIADVQRLPEQQRSALLMRELGGVAYADIAGALAVSVPAVKSLLVRARVGLAQASEARDTACAEIRENLILSHDRGVRTSGLARRHMRDCASCREFRGEVRSLSRQFAALTPALGPAGVVAKLLGLGGGGGAAAGGMSSG
ncbi:MAG: RNA polymerase sigma factor, partial [Solirubrobacteraceae bacterium]